MKNTQVSEGDEFTLQISEGVRIVRDVVSSTMGAQGKYVILVDENNYKRITKDGASVANEIRLEHPVQAMGANAIIEASLSTVRKIGDGTTTTALLAAQLYLSLLQMKKSGKNQLVLTKKLSEELEMAKNLVKKYTKKTNKKNMMAVAMVSANHDKEIAKNVVDVWRKIGKNGIVNIMPSDDTKTTFEIKDGYRLNQGYIYKGFATEKLEFVSKGAYVISTNHNIITLASIQKLVIEAMNQKKDLVIFANSFSNEALASMLDNKKAGKINILPIEKPSFGDNSSLGEELSAVSNGSYISMEETPNIGDAGIEMLGYVETVISDSRNTVFTFNPSHKLSNYIETLNLEKNKSKSMMAKSKYMERIARVEGKMATIRVGADTTTEFDFKFDMYDDCVKAVKNFLETGHVVGGGATYLQISKDLKNIYGNESILSQVLKEPMKKLLENSGYEEKDAERMVLEASKNEYGFGFDLNSVNVKQKNSTFVSRLLGGIVLRNQDYKKHDTIDLEKAGIIEPSGLADACISNACSVANLLFNSKFGISTTPDFVM
jgi:chaperonin GroEL